jgi:uncharacterized protein with NRDE domain
MCVAAIAIGAHPAWPLVVASNRDEFYERPSSALARWTSTEGHSIVSGRDLRDGGTWLGFSGTRAALLTNVREGAAARGTRSRGELALKWFHSGADVYAFYAQLPLAEYGGFNLMLGDWAKNEWFYISNRGPQAGKGPLALENGVYGLSNASLDTPWPKTEWVKTALQHSLDVRQDGQALCDQLMAALAHSSPASDAQLPQTGVAFDWERRLSSVFITQPALGYGTRCSTVALLSTDRRLWVTERSHPNPLLTADPPWPKTVAVFVPS